MDPRSFYYHHSTHHAASHPPPPAHPPPPPHHIPANPSFYNLPPPPSYPPPVSQPQFNPQNPQFPIHASNVVNPNHTVHDDYYSRSYPQHPSFPQPPRALHPGSRHSDIPPRRLPEFNHYGRDSRPDFRDSPRVLSDSRGRSDFVQDRYGREVNMDHDSPVRVRRELDGKSRFSGDVNGRTEQSLRGEGFLGRDDPGYHHSRDQHRSSRDYMVALHHHNSDSRGFDSESMNYERRFGLISDHGRASENNRVIHDREVRRDVPHSMVVMGNEEFTHGDHLRTSSGKREHYISREESTGSDWHNGKVNREESKGCRESSYEFDHTPKKQTPKKSAFLRIQKPMFKNKENHKTHSSGYYGDNKSGARGKDHSLNRSCSKPSEGGIKLNSVIVKNAASPCKDLELSKENVGASSTAKTNTSSVPGSCGNGVASGEAMLEGSGKDNPSDEGRSSVISSSASLETAAKKRKVVRQLVKKNVQVNVGLSSSQPAKFPDDSSAFQICPKDLPVMPENGKLETLEKAAVSDEPNSNGSLLHDASIEIGDSQLCPNDLLLRCENDKLETFEKVVVSHKSDSVKNVLNDASVEVGDSQHYLNDLPVMLDASEKGMVSDKSIFDSNLVHDAPGEIGDSLLCAKGLPLMPRNRKPEASEKDMISEKPNSDENFVHDASVEIGDSPFRLNDVPVIPESEKLGSLEKDSVSGKPILDENYMNTASVEISDSMHWPDDSHVICASDNQIFQKAMLSDKTNSDVSFVHDAPVHDLHVTISRVDGNLSTDSNADVPSTSERLSFSDRKGGTLSQGFLSEEQHANFNSEKNKVLEDPINSCNKDTGIESYPICLQEGGFRSAISVVNSPDKQDFTELPNASRENGQNQRSSAGIGLAGQCNEIFCHPKSDNVGIAGVTATAACYGHGMRAVLGSDNSSSSHEVRYDVVRQSSPDEATKSVENSTLRCVNDRSCVNSSCNTPKGDSGSKNGELNAFGFSRSRVEDMDLANEHNSAAWVDTTLRLSFKDATTDLKDSSDVGLHPAIDGTDVGKSGSLTAALGAKVLSSSPIIVELDATSLRCKKKRRISAAELDLSFAFASQVNERANSASVITAGAEVISDSCSDPTSFVEPLCTLDLSGSRKGFDEGDMSMEASASIVNEGATSANLPTHDVEVFSHSCNDESKEGSAPSVDPLCALDWSGSHKQHNEGDMSTAVSASAVEMTSSSESSPTHSGVDVAISSITDPCTSDLQFAKKGNSMLVDNHPRGGCFNTKASIDRVHHEDKIDMPRYVLPIVQNLFSSSKSRKTADATIVMNDRIFPESMDFEIGNEHGIEPEAVEGQVVTNSMSTHPQCRLPSQLESLMSNEALTAVNMETDSSYLEKNNPPSVSNHHSLSVDLNDHITEILPDADKVVINNGSAPDHHASDFHSPVANETLDVVGTETGSSCLEKVNLPSGSNRLALSKELNHQIMEISPVAIAEISYPEKLTGGTETSIYQNLTGKSSGSDGIPSEKPATEGRYRHNICLQNRRNVVCSDQAVGGGISFLARPPNLMPKASHDIIHKQSGISELSCGKKHQSSSVISRTQSHSSSFVLTALRSASLSTHISKPRTWHRSDSSTVSTLPGQEASSSIITKQRQHPKSTAGAQTTSYIRKGNSLVRKPSPVAARSEGSSASDAVNYKTVSDSRVDVVGASVFVRAVETNSSIERPRTPLPIVPKVAHHGPKTSVDRRSSPVVESHLGDSVRSKSDPLVVVETKDTSKSSESMLRTSEAPAIQTGQVKNLEISNEVNEGRVGSSNVNITYVKRKSNQLVATSSLSTVLPHGPCDSQALSSESYYKRRRNQLVRTTLDDGLKPGCRSSDDRNFEGNSALGMKSSGSLSKRQLRKVVTKIKKPSKYSFVWTLNGTKSSKDKCHALHYQRILPNLFPWKRATYRRNFLPSSLSSSKISSIISKKLLLSRSHDAIYTRSKHGFSLRKSKVLSVGGSSLKWSKSIQSRSKKANEEATLEVAAADKKKREQNGVGDLVPETKNRNNSPNELSAYSCAPQTEKEAKKPYVPRRFTIGKDEYVRIGSGNKLIRNPKKRSRILASEKVRWSLHTARTRLAKKRKYCQFFTRFGKCNKDDDGKCPYIHDPSKIAVCTKFLNGLCSNADCKLTHKVIPERMPDCSYFLQGLCTNKSCPYRHVNVSRSASTCEGFLKGYCADGNECQKKHSYVCPSYEATGTCPQGSKCKLHHRKNRVKGKKPYKRLREKNQHGHGRYFSSTARVSAASRSGTSVVERPLSEIGDAGADFISLGFSDDEEAAGEECSNNRRDDDDIDEQLNWSDDGEDLEDLEVSNLDELIKPVRILNIR
ncbi:unnamed protein product [Linum trigynum]|uniref:C3H1-type domain-containing protein n=1 Tax=Linum trigynum TaxID=586398 RepID=A0AAV2D0C2_9ROSI